MGMYGAWGGISSTMSTHLCVPFSELLKLHELRLSADFSYIVAFLQASELESWLPDSMAHSDWPGFAFPGRGFLSYNAKPRAHFVMLWQGAKLILGPRLGFEIVVLLICTSKSANTRLPFPVVAPSPSQFVSYPFSWNLRNQTHRQYQQSESRFSMFGISSDLECL